MLISPLTGFKHASMIMALPLSVQFHIKPKAVSPEEVEYINNEALKMFSGMLSGPGA